VAWDRAVFSPNGPVPLDAKSESTSSWPLPMRDHAPTLAEAMRARGYETRVCASIPFQTPAAGLVRGFDTVDEGVSRARNADLKGTTSEALTACGLAMIREARGRPLFLWLHYADAHAPYVEHPETPPTDNSPRARYDGEVRYIESHLAGLFGNIDRTIGLDDTLVVLTADHGEEFGEHDGAFHGATLYEEVLRVPLLFAGRGIAPREAPESVSLLDVAPTLLELVGAAPLAGAEGRSLAAAIRGEPLAERPTLAETVRAERPRRAIVDGRYKLVYGARARTYSLYDLDADPLEQHVITDEHLDVTRRLAAAMGAPVPP
jgi:membrane-anchored protein YejM (alkaline phosphatase superfamily)